MARLINYKKCIECNEEIGERPKGYSCTSWSNKKFCNFKCWGKFKSKIMKGTVSNMKGKKMSESSKEKIRLAHLGSRSSLWKGGITENKKEYYNLKSLERYARLKGAFGVFTLDEWYNVKCSHDFRCAHCGKSEKEIKLTKDHIIPLTKGGNNLISNIQPLCQSCNSSKSNKIIL